MQYQAFSSSERGTQTFGKFRPRHLLRIFKIIAGLTFDPGLLSLSLSPVPALDQSGKNISWPLAASCAKTFDFLYRWKNFFCDWFVQTKFVSDFWWSLPFPGPTASVVSTLKRFCSIKTSSESFKTLFLIKCLGLSLKNKLWLNYKRN